MLSMNNTAREFETTRPVIAVLPVGAVEQHGNHLPVGTDCFISSALAERVARRLDACLLPCLPISSSIEHRERGGTVYLQSTTLALVIGDIARSLHFGGYRKLILINGHGGNWVLKPTIRQLNRELDRLVTVLLHTSVGSAQYGKIMQRQAGDIHAGEKETSVMLHLHAPLVKPLPPAHDHPAPPQEYLDYFDCGDLTPDGTWGQAHLATADKGAQLLDLMEQSAMDYLEQLDAYRAKLADRAGH